MDKKQKTSPQQDLLFRQAMDDVTPLKAQARTESRSARTPVRQSVGQTTADNKQVRDIDFDVDKPHDFDNGDSSHRKNGVRLKVMQKLKRGRFQVGDTLDLHHMNQQTANHVLLKFIADGRAKAFESVRVIHGKGLRSENSPKLKIMTRKVLRDHPQVLAFTDCKPANGGDGAVDVLLKSK